MTYEEVEKAILEDLEALRKKCNMVNFYIKKTKNVYEYTIYFDKYNVIKKTLIASEN